MSIYQSWGRCALVLVFVSPAGVLGDSGDQIGRKVVREHSKGADPSKQFIPPPKMDDIFKDEKRTVEMLTDERNQEVDVLKDEAQNAQNIAERLSENNKWKLEKLGKDSADGVFKQIKDMEKGNPTARQTDASDKNIISTITEQNKELDDLSGVIKKIKENPKYLPAEDEQAEHSASAAGAGTETGKGAAAMTAADEDAMKRQMRKSVDKGVEDTLEDSAEAAATTQADLKKASASVLQEKATARKGTETSAPKDARDSMIQEKAPARKGRKTNAPEDAAGQNVDAGAAQTKAEELKAPRRVGLDAVKGAFSDIQALRQCIGGETAEEMCFEPDQNRVYYVYIDTKEDGGQNNSELKAFQGAYEREEMADDTCLKLNEQTIPDEVLRDDLCTPWASSSSKVHRLFRSLTGAFVFTKGDDPGAPAIVSTAPSGSSNVWKKLPSSFSWDWHYRSKAGERAEPLNADIDGKQISIRENAKFCDPRADDCIQPIDD